MWFLPEKDMDLLELELSYTWVISHYYGKVLFMSQILIKV